MATVRDLLAHPALVGKYFVSNPGGIVGMSGTIVEIKQVDFHTYHIILKDNTFVLDLNEVSRAAWSGTPSSRYFHISESGGAYGLWIYGMGTDPDGNTDVLAFIRLGGNLYDFTRHGIEDYELPILRKY